MRRVLRTLRVWLGALAVGYALFGLVFFWFGSYDREQCRRLKDAIDDGQVRYELIRWADGDLEQALQDWLENGPPLHLNPASDLGSVYFRKHDFDLALIGLEPEDRFSGPKIGLVTWHPQYPHYRQSTIKPDKGLEFLLSNTRSVSFGEVPRHGVLVRMLDAPDFGVNPDHIVKVEGRLAVYCAPRED